MHLHKMIIFLDEMITMRRPFYRNFANRFITIESLMAKTQRQHQAMDYAMDYLERLLRMEDVMGRSIDDRIHQAVRNYMEEQKAEKTKKNV